MKYVIGFLPFIYVSSLLATDLCDLSCDLSITFPDGGSIKVDDDTTIFFGAGAFVNNGSSTITYPVGEELELDDDGSIEFQDGGEFDIGRGGNIKYKDIEITSNGIIELLANGENGLVNIDEMKLKDDVLLYISSDIKVSKGGKLKINDGLVIATSELTFINLGDVKGRFQFKDSIINFIKDKKSYKNNSAIEKILSQLREGAEDIKEITKSEKISGEVFLDTDEAFILIPDESGESGELDDSEDKEDKEDKEDSGVPSHQDEPLNVTSASPGTQIENTGVSDNPVQSESPLNNSVSIQSAGANNLFILVALLLLKLLQRSSLLKYR